MFQFLASLKKILFSKNFPLPLFLLPPFPFLNDSKFSTQVLKNRVETKKWETQNDFIPRSTTYHYYIWGPTVNQIGPSILISVTYVAILWKLLYLSNRLIYLVMAWVTKHQKKIFYSYLIVFWILFNLGLILAQKTPNTNSTVLSHSFATQATLEAVKVVE